MFRTDVKRVSVCIKYKDYYSAMRYSMIVKDKYTFERKEYFEKVIKYVKNADYIKLNNMIILN